jgi:glycosyltransferase involved in cell wall biosynthesis
MPKVSFVVPCYRLAHLLPECVRSILAQTYRDFEVLVMDDCSPDETPAVARGFQDPRVRHVRNETNLGHLRNYNRGIELARGDYVWLISADDLLRRTHALERYVGLLEAHPRVGYVFCPGVGLRDGRETGLLAYSQHGDRDAIFDGPQFLSRLLRGNSVVAASGLVRRSLYERLGAFPQDLPYAGDWYLWLRFALHGDVGYFAEPMVSYREHAQSATTGFMGDPRNAWKAEGITVAWRIKRAVEATPHAWLVAECDRSLVRQYSSSLTRFGLRMVDLDRSLDAFAYSRAEARRIRTRALVHAGDAALRAGNRRLAAELYGEARRAAPAGLAVWAKLALVQLGTPGDRIRDAIGALGRHGRGTYRRRGRTKS